MHCKALNHGNAARSRSVGSSTLPVANVKSGSKTTDSLNDFLRKSDTRDWSDYN